MTGTGISGRRRRTFVSTSSADRWDRGVLTGSGRVGAVVWGDHDEHVVTVAHERFFLPAYPRPRAPSLAEVRPRAREALLAGDAATAAQVVNDAVAASGYDSASFASVIWTDPLVPCSELRVRFEGSAESPGNYRRRVDLDSGEVLLSWGAGRQVRVVAPRGSETVRVILRSEADEQVVLRLGMPQDDRADLPSAVNYAEDVVSRVERVAGGVRLGVVPVDRSVSAIAADTVLSVAADQDVRLDEDVATVRLTLKAGEESAVELRISVTGVDTDPGAEIGDHAALQAASFLDLRSGVDETVPTEQLLAEAPHDERMRRALIELAYAAGRYTTISSTGELPPTLQGVWQGTWSPAWSADYTMNGNVQNGGAASLIPTGTPDLIRSLARLVLPHVDDFRSNARNLYGFDGMMLPSRMSSHGLANHFHAAFPHQFWTSCGGWVLRMLADAVLATGDRTLVDDETWSLVEETLLFYRQLTAEGPFAPAYSPENTPAGAVTPLTVDPAMDVAVARDVVRAGRVLAEARGTRSLEFATEARYRIEHGRLAEWSAPGQPDELAHRHTSQLYPLWYDPDEAMEDPELRAAAHRLVIDKIAWRAEDPTAPPGRMEMAFGLAQLGLAATALGDAAAAEQCVRWLAELHHSAAMTTTHDAGAIFNVDAAGALPAVIASMLIRSTRDRIHVLPAVPEAWAEGSAGGLTTRTGLTVDLIEWDPCRLVLELSGEERSDWVRANGVELVLPRSVPQPEGGETDRVRLPEGRTHRFEWAWPAATDTSS